jgi:hypothetical protein
MNRMYLNNLVARNSYEHAAVESEMNPTSNFGDSKRVGSLSTVILSFTKKCTVSNHHVSTTELLPTAQGYSNHASVRLKKQRKKRRKQWHISTKRKTTTYRPKVSYHHVRGGDDIPLDFYMESTLYTIPEHGAGLCHMRYVTKNALGAKKAWSIHEQNSRPHHRRSTVVLSGNEPTDRYELFNEIGNTNTVLTTWCS